MSVGNGASILVMLNVTVVYVVREGGKSVSMGDQALMLVMLNTGLVYFVREGGRVYEMEL
jgi:hypothetical protein